MKFALLRERKASGDQRVLFTPTQLATIQRNFPNFQFVVEASPTRCFNDNAYQKAGITVTNDVSDCDVFMGIKEVPAAQLIIGKTYFFFSHTTKMQPHNKSYLQAIKDKKITFLDYENLTDSNGKRLVAFGKIAGQIGAYHALRTYGLKNQLFHLPKPNEVASLEELCFITKNLSLPPIKMVVTGSGNVGKGVADFLLQSGVTQVTPSNFLSKNYHNVVFTVLKRKNYLVQKNNTFYNNFFHYAKQAQLFIAGHYYDGKMPDFFTTEQLKSSDFKINTIADISCDLHQPIPSTIKVSTSKNPIYGYDKLNGQETNWDNNNALAVMAIDNLPNELPKSASESFGKQFMEKVLPLFDLNFSHPTLQKALVMQQGKFTTAYKYLEDFLKTETINNIVVEQ